MTGILHELTISAEYCMIIACIEDVTLGEHIKQHIQEVTSNSFSHKIKTHAANTQTMTLAQINNCHQWQPMIIYTENRKVIPENRTVTER